MKGQIKKLLESMVEKKDNALLKESIKTILNQKKSDILEQAKVYASAVLFDKQKQA